MDEERDDADRETVTECCMCGAVKLCTWVCDPYIDEIYPEDENDEDWWCDDCLNERRAEI